MRRRRAARRRPDAGGTDRGAPLEGGGRRERGIRPDGTGTDTITPSNGAVYAVSQGNNYKVVTNGGADFTWKISNGLVLVAFSHGHGTELQYENGTLLGTRPLVFHNQSFKPICTSHLLSLQDTGDTGFEILNRGTG